MTADRVRGSRTKSRERWESDVQDADASGGRSKDRQESSRRRSNVSVSLFSLARSSSLSPPLSRSLSFFSLSFILSLSSACFLSTLSSCNVDKRERKPEDWLFFSSVVLSACFLSTLSFCWFFHPIDSFILLILSCYWFFLPIDSFILLTLSSCRQEAVDLLGSCFIGIMKLCVCVCVCVCVS